MDIPGKSIAAEKSSLLVYDRAVLPDTDGEESHRKTQGKTDLERRVSTSFRVRLVRHVVPPRHGVEDHRRIFESVEQTARNPFHGEVIG